MKDIIRIILIYAIISVVLYTTSHKENALWNLVYYMPVNCIVAISFIMIWRGFEDTLTRSLLIALTAYFLYEMVMDIIHIFNENLYQNYYLKAIIKYVLALGFSLTLLIIPIWKKIKRK